MSSSSSEAPMVHDDSAEARLAAARRYLTTTPVVNDWVEQLAQVLGDSPARREQLRGLLAPHGDRIEATHIAALIKHMTAAEIDALAQFQSSPLGRSILRKQAAIQAEIQPVLLPILQAVAAGALRTPP